LSEAKERVARTKGLTWPAFLSKHCETGRRRADELIAMAEGRVTLADIRAGYAKANAKRNTGHVHAQSSKIHQQEQRDDDVESDDDEMAAPAQIEDNVLYAIQRINENARVFSTILKASALNREAAGRINTALERMIQKWRSIQSTLEKKGARSVAPRVIHTDDPIQEACDDRTNDADRWERSLSNMAGEAIAIPAFWTREFGKEWRNFEVPSTAVTLAKQAAKMWTELAADLAQRQHREQPPTPAQHLH
jgi:hypothetical protein